MNRGNVDRRAFFGAASGALAAGTVVNSAQADNKEDDGRPPVTNPRATSGDDVAEPNWNDRLSITVGPQNADLVGTGVRVLQAAVDYIAGFGGGTVQVLPGRYELRNSVFLRSGVRIRGSGERSVLVKAASTQTQLSADSDWYDQEITLTNANGFELGDGVCLRTRNPHNGGSDVLKRTLIARAGNRFKLDRPLRKNYWLRGNSTAATLFPILSGEEIEDVIIENITLDGNRANNANLDGNYAGCIFLQDCNKITMRNVTARNYNGDGISWQICHDVIVENCHSHDNAGLGLHPGSGSQRPVMRGNRLERNNIGLFFCWGVRHGLAENNRIVGNRSYGISIGHRDTDNLIRNNEVRDSGRVGVLFRPERGRSFAPHRNRLENNRIVNSGGDDGVAIDIQGEVQDLTISGNQIRESRGAGQRVGIRVGRNTRNIALNENDIRGVAVEIQRQQ